MGTTKEKTKKTEAVETKVIVRTYSAGVHFGTLDKRDGKEVHLKNAKRVWQWKGAWTLHELATTGPGEGSKISAAVPSVIVTEAIEIITCTPEGAAKMEQAGWAS